MIIRLLNRLLGDRRGATAIEYGLIASLVVIALIASFQAVATVTVGMWGTVDTKVSAAGAAK